MGKNNACCAVMGFSPKDIEFWPAYRASFRRIGSSNLNAGIHIPKDLESDFDCRNSGGIENSHLHSMAVSEKAGNFNPDCRALVSRRTDSDPHISANIEETGGKL
ncbi:hypothetical protein RG963_00485 [Methanosarcina sp. Z-7115]|uniref:Uncharacterized protein n=1 Tax=Methanosarcina baikalica TaxID=3073890 RepID=A0ABU2CX28_9EURY|nr:hypothetical protein [Methanosarcina sp. Z-7115]MDR7664281.1 hypothetical protein [Methanosarcina sp. Z-7115]